MTLTLPHYCKHTTHILKKKKKKKTKKADKTQNIQLHMLLPLATGEQIT